MCDSTKLYTTKSLKIGSEARESVLPTGRRNGTSGLLMSAIERASFRPRAGALSALQLSNIIDTVSTFTTQSITLYLWYCLSNGKITTIPAPKLLTEQ